MDPTISGISTVVRVRYPLPGPSPYTCTTEGEFQVYEEPTQDSSVTVFLRITCTGPDAGPSSAEHPNTTSAGGTMPFYPVVEGEQTTTTFSVTAPAAEVVAAYRAQWEAAGWTILAQRQEGSTISVRVTGDAYDQRGIRCLSWGGFRVTPRVGPQGGEGSAVAVETFASCSNGFIY